MAAWVFSGVLVGFMALLLVSLTVAAHCINPARRHNSLRAIRLQFNQVSRCLCCGAVQLHIPDPVADPWFQDPARLSGGPRVGGGTAGISQALLSLLPTYTVPAGSNMNSIDQTERKGSGGMRDKGDECAICQEEVAGGHTLALLPCGHGFHEPCISKWLLRKARCPMCQQEVTEESVKEQCPSPGDVAISGLEPAPGAPLTALSRAQSV